MANNNRSRARADMSKGMVTKKAKRKVPKKTKFSKAKKKTPVKRVAKAKTTRSKRSAY